MKYINTLLLLAIAIAVACNFYYDHHHYVALRSRIDSLSVGKTAAKGDEPGPFDKQPNSPMDDSQRPPSGGTTTISFDRTAHDFGRVETGPIYSTSFKFKNTGSENLYISAADASCGCTVPKWSKDAIKPGDTGEIYVQFDSKGRQGQQLKTVTVTTNTEPPQNVLTLNSFLYLKTK
jgi:hypothetical protein